MSNIVLIGEYFLDVKDAATIRATNMSKLCQESGYNPILIGRYKEDINYEYYLSKKKSSKINKVLSLIKKDNEYIEVLENVINKYEVEAIIIYASLSHRYVKQVVKFCHQNNIRCICDISERYQPSQYKYSYLNIKYYQFEYRFRKIFSQSKYIIGCSEYVCNYFKNKGCATLRLNALTSHETNTRNLDYNPVVFTYAGMINGDKDLLSEYLKAFTSLNKDNYSKVVFNIVGPTLQQVNNLMNKDNLNIEDYDFIKVHGRVSNEKVLNILSKTHYSLLLRPNKRYAAAGFPSKVAEAMSNRVVMFCNITSDLKDYLNDNNSVIIKSLSYNEIKDLIENNILLKSNKEYQLLSDKAYEVSQECFSIKCNIEKFKIMIKG